MQHAVIFKEAVSADERFEIAAPVHLGLVCFRLKVCENIFPVCAVMSQVGVGRASCRLMWITPLPSHHYLIVKIN